MSETKLYPTNDRLKFLSESDDWGDEKKAMAAELLQLREAVKAARLEEARKTLAILDRGLTSLRWIREEIEQRIAQIEGGKDGQS